MINGVKGPSSPLLLFLSPLLICVVGVPSFAAVDEDLGDTGGVIPCSC